MKLLILAAGQGKRLGCEETQIPKVMRKAVGKPLLQYVLDAASFVPEKDVWAVLGFRKEVVTEAYPKLNYVVQNERRGTGHAVMCAAEVFEGYDGDVMVINGDMPLLSRHTLESVLALHCEKGAECTMATFVVKGQIPPFGHIVRDEEGYVARIVEHKDATEEEKQIRELNAGLYVFKAASLTKALGLITPSAVSGEYYLTDVPSILKTFGGKTAAYVLEDDREVLGVNTSEDLAAVEAVILNK